MYWKLNFSTTDRKGRLESCDGYIKRDEGRESNSTRSIISKDSEETGSIGSRCGLRLNSEEETGLVPHNVRTEDLHVETGRIDRCRGTKTLREEEWEWAREITAGGSRREDRVRVESVGRPKRRVARSPVARIAFQWFSFNLFPLPSCENVRIYRPLPPPFLDRIRFSLPFFPVYPSIFK